MRDMTLVHASSKLGLLEGTVLGDLGSFTARGGNGKELLCRNSAVRGPPSQTWNLTSMSLNIRMSLGMLDCSTACAQGSAPCPLHVEA